MQIISGREVADEILSELQQKIENELSSRPKLAVILVGDDPASAIYVRNKIKICKHLGIENEDHFLSNDTTQLELNTLIKKLNDDDSVHGILCQFPLPKHLNQLEVSKLIDPTKDVDCFHPMNIGLLAINHPNFMPVTPFGIVQILRRKNIDIAGKHVVIVGRGMTVGKPLSILLAMQGIDATVTLCNSKTQNLKDVCKSADILVVAIGRPEFITKDFIKPGSVIIDVGINRVEDPSSKRGYRVVGDVLRSDADGLASALTPVPGGVGPVTIAMLMYNVVESASKLRK